MYEPARPFRHAPKFPCGRVRSYSYVDSLSQLRPLLTLRSHLDVTQTDDPSGARHVAARRRRLLAFSSRNAQCRSHAAPAAAPARLRPLAAAAAPAPKPVRPVAGPLDPNIAAIVLAANNTDISYARLAPSRAQSPAVKEFAAQMLTDHTGVNRLVSDLLVRTSWIRRQHDEPRLPRRVGHAPRSCCASSRAARSTSRTWRTRSRITRSSSRRSTTRCCRARAAPSCGSCSRAFVRRSRRTSRTPSRSKPDSADGDAIGRRSVVWPSPCCMVAATASSSRCSRNREHPEHPEHIARDSHVAVRVRSRGDHAPRLAIRSCGRTRTSSPTPRPPIAARGRPARSPSARGSCSWRPTPAVSRTTARRIRRCTECSS